MVYSSRKSSVYTVKKSVVTVEQEHCFFVLNTATVDPRPFRLEGGAQLIWSVLTQRAIDFDGLLEMLSAWIEPKPINFAEEVDTVVQDLVSKGLLLEIGATVVSETC